ncbi:PhzF family phenazine biosynthesis protein [Salinimicrobium oceani]|uniref:PhzF family phenazine biosynthesis protein n=1 Tax=Salinimicrobium oceani TaxID=2722702 RepID=A0ABX1D1D7_9FLAO|nr:PhzF family phenazine biosynthesis protein [Salinimicrobium oceani]NJW52493.1 PhzF family phenazine biosynthesis protein [Salinimicrobium oceani]
MQLHIYQVNAFTNRPFGGNPACVVPLSEWLEDDLLLKIAQENAVAETAFFVDQGYKFQLRWFTPEMEMDLCGHATLAAAHAIKEIRKSTVKNVIFETRSGELTVKKQGDLYILDLPSRRPTAATLPQLLASSLNIQPREVLKARDYVLVYRDQKEVEEIVIDRTYFDLLELGTGGVIVTAQGRDRDFVSRFFTPGASVFEDPVTGSAHCSLVPYWSEILQKDELKARQISERGGELFCKQKEERVEIAGYARTYFIGKIFVEAD